MVDVLPLVLLLSLSLLLHVAVNGQKFDGVVRPTGDGRFEAYMIPPNTSNHASFLELLPAPAPGPSNSSGELVMAWFSGLAEGTSNCSIVVARLPAGSLQWSRAQAVSSRVGYSNQNPVLYYDAADKVLNLFHSQQPADHTSHASHDHDADQQDTAASSRLPDQEDRAKIWHSVSKDGEAREWGPPVLLFDKDGSYDRNRIILSLESAWLFPIYYSVSGIENQYSAVAVGISTNSSDEYDRHWMIYQMNDTNYLIQPSVVRPKAGAASLLAFFRDKRKQNIYTSTSSNEGRSWTKPVASTLPNNDAAIQATVLNDGAIALVYNPTTSHRYPIRISLSEDGGKTWPYSRDLDTGEGSTELSYPSILQSPDGWIHISYTYNRQTIKYVKLKEEWIKQKME